MSAIGEAASPWLTAREGGSAGFTLIEMLVAVGILALITGIAFPALQHQLSGQALGEARSTLALAAAEARGDALAGGTPVRLSLAEAGNMLQLSSGRRALPLPAGTVLDWPSGGLLFYGDGSALAASGVIRSSGAFGSGASLRFTLDGDQGWIGFAP